MKVLHVSMSDGAGGAARAAYRLHQALRGIGVDSEMIVSRKTTDDPTVSGPAGVIAKALGLARGRIDRLPATAYPNRSSLPFSSSWFPFSTLLRGIRSSDADVVHLHWIAGGVLPLKHLKKIDRPIVWTLHDMWPFTGGCHYDAGCGRFSDRCGRCPQLGSSRSADLSRLGHWRKRRAYRELPPIHIVGSSRWVADEAARSSLMKNMPVTVLPNPIDCETFAPVPMASARSLLGLPAGAKLVLFGAVRPTQNVIKGFDVLIEALKSVTTEDCELVVVGSAQQADFASAGRPVHILGHITDDVALRLAYSAADVAVVPSLQDNLPLVVAEALACGTPVAAFGVGGLLDMVEHQETGYLAKPFVAEDLARGIDWILQHPDTPRLRNAARSSVTKRYESSVVALQYRGLYEAMND